MATINSFEDLEVWKKARILAHDVYQIISTGSLSSDYRLKDQMNGASGSIMDNIAEGFERDGKAEFIAFLGYSKGSAGELCSQLHRALDRKHISQEKFDELYSKTIEVEKMIGGFMSYLRKSDIKGNKFKGRD
jgi:four helix bundle protein